MRIDRGEFLFDTTETLDEEIAANQLRDGLSVEKELVTTLTNYRSRWRRVGLLTVQ